MSLCRILCRFEIYNLFANSNHYLFVYIPSKEKKRKREEDKVRFRFTLENVTMCAASEGADVYSECEQQLKIHQLPVSFDGRYGDGAIPETIYVRESYRNLYETASASMHPNQPSAATLFTGVPGIGKSLFLVYFIFRFLHDERFEDKFFAVEFADSKEYWCFKPTADATEFSCTLESSKFILPKPFLLLCDINTATEPASRAKWTFIFSSPNDNRYKQIMKAEPNFEYTMPTWSEQELLLAMGNRSQWYDNFVLVGGVPRHVFGKNPHKKLENVITKKGGAIVESFFKSGFGTLDTEENYMIVHINPPMVDGKFVYDGIVEYSFASDKIFQRLEAMYNTQMLAGAAGMFNSGVASENYGAVSAGNLFEKICLYLKPLNGTITAAKLGGGDKVTFDVPTVRYPLPGDWKETGELPVNAHILPRISNLESGDSFFVEDDGHDGFRLVVFQITVGQSHPVKANGLGKIVKSFPEEVRKKIKEKLLVFVIPKHGTLVNVQQLVTKNNTETVKLTTNVRDFQQYVYRHEISTATRSLDRPLAT